MVGAAVQAVVLGRPFSSEARALFARCSTPPTPGRRQQIDTLIRALKAADIWSRLDALYVMAAADSQVARLNWIADQYNLNAINAPTFTADRGYTGDGISSHLTTGLAPSALVKGSQNSVHLAGWMRNNNNQSTSILGTVTATGQFFIQAKNTTGYNVRINTTTNFQPASPPSDVSGFNAADRSGSAVENIYLNGAAFGSPSTAVSTTPVSDPLLLLRVASIYSASQLAVATIGASLSASQHLALYNALRAYLQAVGAA